MIEKTKIAPDDLKVIVRTDKFRIEEIGDKETGEVHNEMFITESLTVDEIIYAVKKYCVEKVWYLLGTDRTHTFPLLMKTRRSFEKETEEKFDIDNAQSMYPVVHKCFFNGKEWRYIYNHAI